MALAAEGGYDAVVMRDLADQADVAVATLYNYFESKDQLLGAAYAEWVSELESRVGRRPARGASPAERVIDVLGRICTALGRQPKLVSAILTAYDSTGHEIAEYEGRVSTAMRGMLSEALQLADPEDERKITRTLEHVLHSALMAWVYGRMEIDDVRVALDDAAHLLLDHRRGR